MMTISDLPVGSHPEALSFPHFPTRFQAVIWRNWEMIAPAVLARVLQTDESTILSLASGLGLRTPPRVVARWLERGYGTVIRANWHLLPYEQLLDLLEWTPDRMDYVLREDDYLFIKLGLLKPRVEPAICRPLTPDEQEHTLRIRETLERRIPDLQAEDGDRPFGFLDEFEAPVPDPPMTPPALLESRPFDLRCVYSYSAVYGDSLIDPSLDPYPDGMLARLAGQGVNAVWLPVILYQLYPWKFGHHAEGFEKRLDSLRRLTERAGRFGISVMLYLNEPRYMPLAFFREHPELKGVEEGETGSLETLPMIRARQEGLNGVEAAVIGSLCTSVPEVQDMLRQGSAWLFTQVPRLGGVFTITMSENLTNCFSHDARRFSGVVECETCTRCSDINMCRHSDSNFTSCPRCSHRRPAEVIAEVNGLIAEGVHSVNPDAPVIAWDWAWSPEWDHEIVDLLPPDVRLMCGSEWGLPTCIGGVTGSLRDYSISQPGPSPRSLSLWEHAHRRGLKTVAKIQANNSFECSTVPYLPVPDLVDGHLDRLAAANVDGLLLTWTLGGYPGGNLELLRQSIDDLAGSKFGRAGDAVRSAWSAFSESFREFPFSAQVAHNGPENVGPKNLLYAEPTGYVSTMTGDPYDHLRGWRSIYPEDVFEQQFRKLSEGWKQGLDILRKAAHLVDDTHRAAFDELERIAAATYCHFRSSYLQIAFVRRRKATDASVRAEVLAILEEEIELAVTLHDIARRDSRIGFEATRHYAYTLQDLREKVLNCEALKIQRKAPHRPRVDGRKE